MIAKKTLFLLGAGASQPYGMPLGSQLRKDIIQGFIPRLKTLLSQKFQRSDMSIQLSLEGLKAYEFVRDFKDSHNKSIDLFLSRHTEYFDVGKLAITITILDYEHKILGNYNKLETDEDWYNYIFHEMTKEMVHVADFDKLLNNYIKFLTFNYDRTLEFFLSKFYFNSFKHQDSENIFSRFLSKIHHVYGSVAEFTLYPPNNPDSLKFGDDYTYDQAVQLSKRILTIDERDGGNINYRKIDSWVKGAPYIYALGFSFAPENISVLNLQNNLSKEQTLFSTAYRLTEGEIKIISETITNVPNLENMTCRFYNSAKCIDLLRDNLGWITSR